MICVLLFLVLLCLDTYRIHNTSNQSLNHRKLGGYTRMIKFCTFPAITLMLFMEYSCSSSVTNRVVTSSGSESTQLFEIDSTVINQDNEREDKPTGKDKYLTTLDLPEFSSGILLGSMLYGDNYDIDVVQLPESESAYLVFSEFHSRDKSGNVYWGLVDSLRITLPEGATIGWPGYVLNRDSIDPEILVLLPEDADWINTEVYDKVLNAWRFDRTTKKIYSVKTDSLSCINESFGVD